MPTHPTTDDRARRHQPRRRRLGALVAGLAALASTVLTAAPASAEPCAPAQLLSYSDVPTEHPFCREIESATDDGWVAGYADGTFRPTDAVSRQAMARLLRRANQTLTGVIVLNPPCTERPFIDVPIESPFCVDIREAAEAGWITGYADGTFRPGSPISRQAAAAMLVRWPGGAPPVHPCALDPFTDVTVAHPFCFEISRAKSYGIVDGYADGTYRPTSPVSRQAIVAMLIRTYGVAVST